MISSISLLFTGGMPNSSATNQEGGRSRGRPDTTGGGETDSYLWLGVGDARQRMKDDDW